jgi:hypothetical protein
MCTMSLYHTNKNLYKYLHTNCLSVLLTKFQCLSAIIISFMGVAMALENVDDRAHSSWLREFQWNCLAKFFFPTVQVTLSKVSRF